MAYVTKCRASNPVLTEKSWPPCTNEGAKRTTKSTQNSTGPSQEEKLCFLTPGAWSAHISALQCRTSRDFRMRDYESFKSIKVAYKSWCPAHSVKCKGGSFEYSLLFLSVCTCVRTHVHAFVFGRSEHNFWSWLSPFRHVSPKDGTQFARLDGSWCAYLALAPSPGMVNLEGLKSA